MLTQSKVQSLLAKVAKAARIEDTLTIDDVVFRMRVISKGEADMIDARRGEIMESLGEQSDVSSHLAEYVSLLKMDTLAYSIIGVDDDKLEVPTFELEDGKRVDKYTFMTEYFLPSLVSSVFDKLYEFYMDLFNRADQKAGLEVRVQTADVETEIQILKDRLDALEKDRVVSKADEEGVPTVSREEARDLVFKPIVKEDSPKVAEDITPILEEDTAKTVTAASPVDQYNQHELDESERLYNEREARRRAFDSAETTRRQPVPDAVENDSYVLESMPRPRLTAQSLNQPPRGTANPNFKGHKP